MSPLEVVLVSGGFTLVGSVLAWFLARLQKRDDHQASSTTPGAPTVQEIWQRQDRMENGFKASLVLLGEIAEQWDRQRPLLLSKKAIKTLRDGDYLPPELDNLLTD